MMPLRNGAAAQDTFSGSTMVMITRTVVACLKASCATGSVALMEDFKTVDGYRALTDVVATLVADANGGRAQSDIEDMLDVICEFAFVGVRDLKPPRGAGAIVEVEGITGNLVRNVDAFSIFQNVFLKYDSGNVRELVCIWSNVVVCSDASARFFVFVFVFLSSFRTYAKCVCFSVCVQVIDRILLRVYALNPVNYVILQDLQTIPMFLELLDSFSEPLKESVLKILEYVVTVMNYTPFKELWALSCLFETKLQPATVRLVFHTVNKLVSFNRDFQKVFQETGLLDVIVSQLAAFCRYKEAQTGRAVRVCEALLSTSCYV